jgi:heme a synthase
MDPVERRLLLLRRLAGVCAALVLVVTSLSAFLRLSHAGLGCADWPACYGQNLRQAQSGAAPAGRAVESGATAAARLGHRILASSALLLIVMLVLVCFGTRPVLRTEGAMALALLALALFLAVLGRWSSAPRVPAVTLGNLLGGFAMLALCTRLAIVGVPIRAPGLRVWVALAGLALVAQVALGGLVSSSYAALSCSGWSDCLAAAQGQGWDTLDPWREPRLIAQPPVNPQGALAHALHLGGGIALLVLAVPLAAFALWRGRPNTGAALLILLVAQAMIGLLMSAASPQLQFAVLHNMLAAALLATLVLLF